MCRTRSIEIDSTVLQLLIPAKLRRITTPKARNKPMPITTAAPIKYTLVSILPVSKRGRITRSTKNETPKLEATVQIAYMDAPPTAMANNRG
jgi:hypothetical protein